MANGSRGRRRNEDEQLERTYRLASSSRKKRKQKNTGSNVLIISLVAVIIIAAVLIGIFALGNNNDLIAQNVSIAGVDVSGMTKQEAIDAGVEYVSLDTLIKESDIISIHLPMTEDTKHIIGEKELDNMKESAIIINVARGPIIDNEALANALNEGKIAGAGIDVFDMEPPIPNDYPLLHAKNALLTPHVGYLTDEAMVLRAQIAFDNVMAYINGEDKNIVSI